MELNEVSCKLKPETPGGGNREEALNEAISKHLRLVDRTKPFEPVDCGTVLGVVLWNVRAEIEKSDAAITLDELPIVTGDETQLIQLFRNLVGNALKYRSERPPRIHISSKRVQEIYGLTFEDLRMQSAVRSLHSTAGRGWLFSVTDSGVGIDPLCFERIFQRPQRHSADEKDCGGTGNGLAICKKIAERHGGRIWVDSEPGMGSTFYFTIP
jgi:light-regulated signal transduction histidine kinase (bacteriophytochrome)